MPLESEQKSLKTFAKIDILFCGIQSVESLTHAEAQVRRRNSLVDAVARVGRVDGPRPSSAALGLLGIGDDRLRRIGYVVR